MIRTITTQTPVSLDLGLAVLILGLAPDLEVRTMDLVQGLGVPIMVLVQAQDLEVRVMDLVQDQGQVQRQTTGLDLEAPTLVLEGQTLVFLEGQTLVVLEDPVRGVAILGPGQHQVLVDQTTALDPVPALDRDLMVVVLDRREVATTRVM